MLRLSLAILGILSFPTRVAAVRIGPYLDEFYSGYCDKSYFLHCDQNDTIVDVITNNLSEVVVVFIGALAVVAILYGALRLIVSRGEEGKEAGKKAILYASLGLVFAVLAWSIIGFVRGTLLQVGS